MQRPIKFRLRDRHNKIVGYEKWYTGSWQADNPDEGYSLGSGWWEAQPCWLYSTDNERWTPTYISHRYKDEYIGLKDKNGKEIYEGDLVKVTDEEIEGATYKVVYGGERDYPAFDLDGHADVDCNALSYYKAVGTLEVIGNIWENKVKE